MARFAGLDLPWLFYLRSMSNNTHASPLPTNARLRKPWLRPIAVALSGFSFLACAVFSDANPAVEVPAQQDGGSADTTAADFVKPSPRLEIFTQFHTGFDDNSQTTSNKSGAWFTSEQVSLSYHLPSRDLQLNLDAGLGFSDYAGERSNADGFISLGLARSFSHRLTLSASIFASYQAEPNFAENVGPDRVRGNYFNTNNNIALSYALAPRLSLVSSFSLQLVRYENNATALFADRQSYGFGEQLRFALTRNTVVTGDYRLLLVDYVTAPFDSTAHFALAGVEHQFSRHLSGQLRAGASIRFPSIGDTQTNPDFEWSLNYTYGRDQLSWNGSYSIEQGTERFIEDRTTFRTGVLYSRTLTARLSGSLAFFYHHDRNQQVIPPFLIGPSFDEDALSATATVRYAVNQRFSIDAGIAHSQILSAMNNREYSRNHYSFGMSYKF